MRRLSQPRADLLAIAALFMLPLAFFWQVTLGSRTLLPADNLYQFQPWAAYRAAQGVPEVPHNMLLSDLVLENWQWKEFIRASLADGELPLWNPYLFAGVPFLAAGQHSALYPFSLIYYLLPLDKAYGWFTVSQLWLAGTFMYLFLRGLGIGRLGALIGGIAFQMSSFFLASVVFQMIVAAAAWLPFLLLMVEFAIRRRPLFGRPTVIPWVALGALGLGMTIYAGHVEFVYYALLVMGFWAAWRLAGIVIDPQPPSGVPRETRVSRRFPIPSLRDRSRGVLGSGVALIAMVVLGMGIGAAQFVPLVELANASSREGRSSFRQILDYAFPPRHIVVFAMPNFYGSPAQHEYFDVFAGQQTRIDWTRPDGARVTDTFIPGGKNYVEGACYVGILTLILAAVAILNGLFERRLGAKIVTAGPYRAILGAVALISLTFVFGLPTYAILYYGLPGFSQLHSPFRWVFPLTLCLAALAGFGAEALVRLRQPSPPLNQVDRELGTPAKHVFRAEPRTGGEASFTARLANRLGIALITGGVLIIAALMGSRLFFDQFRELVAGFYNILAGADLAFPSVEAFYSHLFINVLIFGVFVLASGIVVWMSRRSRAWGALALAVLTLDLAVASAGFNPAADPKWLEFTPPAIQWLQAQNPDEWRFTAVQGPTATMNANAGWRYGLQDIRGYDSIIPRQYVQYMEQIQPQSQLLYNRIAPIFPDTLDALASPWLDRLAVRYVLSEIDLDTSRYAGYRQVYTDEAIKIYENTRALPRAGLLSAPSCADAEIGAASITPAKLIETRNIQVMVSASVPDGALGRCLFLADSDAPGWRAYLRPEGAPEDQEREVSITRLLGNFRGIDLPPGDWTVRFRYSPPSFQVGAFMTFLALVAVLFAGMVWVWRHFFSSAAAGESSGVRRFAKNSLAPIALNLFNRFIDLAFALIMLRLLGPANAGTYYYAVVIFGWFDILTNFGLNTLLTREAARDRSAARKLLLNSAALRLGLAALGVPLLIGFLVVRGALPGLEPLDGTAVVAILLLYVGLVPNSLSTGLSALFYAFEKAETPAAISTITAILKAAFGLAALIAGWGVIGLAGVSIGLNVITLAMLAWSVRGVLPSPRGSRGVGVGAGGEGHLDPSLLRAMLGSGWPLMLNHLLATIFFKIDVVLLEPLKGATVVGQYSTAYKWVDALGVIPALFTMALLPIMARQAVEDKAAMQRGYHFAVKLLYGLALPTAVVTTFLAEFLINVLGGARFLPDGAIALQLMIWFIPIGWINSLTNYVLIALDQQKPMRWAFLAGVGFNILANLLFIPLYSYRASAVVTIFSEGVLLVGFYLLLRRALAPIPWIALLWKPTAAAALMALALALVWPAAPLLALLLAAILYPTALLALRPFDAWERARIGELLPARLRRIVTPI